jgi:hypothetical protein
MPPQKSFPDGTVLRLARVPQTLRVLSLVASQPMKPRLRLRVVVSRAVAVPVAAGNERLHEGPLVGREAAPPRVLAELATEAVAHLAHDGVDVADRDAQMPRDHETISRRLTGIAVDPVRGGDEVLALPALELADPRQVHRGQAGWW